MVKERCIAALLFLAVGLPVWTLQNVRNGDPLVNLAPVAADPSDHHPHRGLSEPDPRLRRVAGAAYEHVPISFEANHGQVHPQVKFLARAGDHTIFLTPEEAVWALAGSASGLGEVVRMRLVGADPQAPLTGLEPLAATRNVFLGGRPEQWQIGIPLYARVKHAGVYPGVDVVYYGEQGQLEYDFLLAPGVEIGAIRLAFAGARRVFVAGDGDLVLQAAAGELRQRRPVVYQLQNGRRVDVSGRFVLRGEREVGFAVGAYDRQRPLVIDPVVTYSTYLGGASIDQGIGVAVDPAGNFYITGMALSVDFPVSQQINSRVGAFVAKFNPTGRTLMYSTVLEGADLQGSAGLDIAVDALGNATVIGRTRSANFPVTAGAVRSQNIPGFDDAFITTLSPEGNRLVYSTLLGGNDHDIGFAVTADAAGNVYVTGVAAGGMHTTAGVFQPALGGGGDGDAFIAKLHPASGRLIYSSYLGGGDTDYGLGIACDAAGRAYVTGYTRSPDFPVANALQPRSGGYNDAFVTKVNADGTGLVYSTYLGGSGGEFYGDIAEAIAVDVAGNAYVTGRTDSLEFPTTPGAFQQARRGNYSGFVTKLDAAGAALVYSTYLGGGADSGKAIEVNVAGEACVGGWTFDAFPVTPDAYQATPGAGLNGFVARLNAAGSAVVYATYLGGRDNDDVQDLALNDYGDVYVTGRTTSPDFPVTANAYQEKPGSMDGDGDAFMIKLGDPRITGVTRRGKKLYVYGDNFLDGAVILLNGEPQATKNDRENTTTLLIGKKAGKKIKPGDRLRVQSPGGTQSAEVIFMGSSPATAAGLARRALFPSLAHAAGRDINLMLREAAAGGDVHIRPCCRRQPRVAPKRVNIFPCCEEGRNDLVLGKKEMAADGGLARPCGRDSLYRNPYHTITTGRRRAGGGSGVARRGIPVVHFWRAPGRRLRA